MSLYNYQKNIYENSNFDYNINSQGNTLNYTKSLPLSLKKPILAGTIVLSLCIPINNTPLIHPTLKNINIDDSIFDYGSNDKIYSGYGYNNHLKKVTILGENKYTIGVDIYSNSNNQEVVDMKKNTLHNKNDYDVVYIDNFFDVKINDLVEHHEKILFSELKIYKEVPVTTKLIGRMPSKPIV